MRNKKVRKWTWETFCDWRTGIPHAASGLKVPSAIFMWQKELEEPSSWGNFKNGKCNLWWVVLFLVLMAPCSLVTTCENGFGHIAIILPESRGSQMCCCSESLQTRNLAFGEVTLNLRQPLYNSSLWVKKNRENKVLKYEYISSSGIIANESLSVPSD